MSQGLFIHSAHTNVIRGTKVIRQDKQWLMVNGSGCRGNLEEKQYYMVWLTLHLNNPTISAKFDQQGRIHLVNY